MIIIIIIIIVEITVWHLDPLIGNDGKISNYKFAVTRQRSVNRKRGDVFSVWSVTRF
jgi:hypothetical protein